MVFARSRVRNERGFFNQLIEDFFRVFQAVFQPQKSESFFAGLAKLYLAAPFGFEDLGGGDTTARVGVED
jgi:hypothetical protein